jgi:hypothetical protein
VPLAAAGELITHHGAGDCVIGGVLSARVCGSTIVSIWSRCRSVVSLSMPLSVSVSVFQRLSCRVGFRWSLSLPRFQSPRFVSRMLPSYCKRMQRANLHARLFPFNSVTQVSRT